MKHIAQSLGLGLALLAATSASPRAADWAVGSGGVIKDFGSIKDYKNAAVPVPAPTPSAAYTKDWYVRGDVGYNFANSLGAEATGGITSRDETTNFLFGSIGAGRYLTPSLRAEMSFDFRPKKAVTAGIKYFDRTIKNQTATTTDTYTFRVAQEDDSNVADQTAFLSLYYDFMAQPNARFKPYVGAGLGLDYRRFTRKTNQLANCYHVSSLDNTTNVVSTFDYSGNPGSLGNPGACGTGSASDSKYASDVGIAAAFMIGAGYEVSPGIVWDAGYRLIWQGAEVAIDARSFDGVTTGVRLTDRFDHELRTGVRVDLY